MKKGTKLLLGGLTITAAAAGVIGAIMMKSDRKPKRRRALETTWARPGMTVTFRAELMPGRDAEQRTYKVMHLLPSGGDLPTTIAATRLALRPAGKRLGGCAA